MMSRNEKPQPKAATLNRGVAFTDLTNSNSTTLMESKSRHDKGMELYKAGKVSIGANGLFKVSGYYECDTENMTCTCPDHRTRKETCKHLFAAMLFVKNRGKQKIEGLNGNSNPEPKEAPRKPTEAHRREFDRQATITRLAVLNTATEILKTHNKPIHSKELFEVASQLEQWALGNE